MSWCLGDNLNLNNYDIIGTGTIANSVLDTVFGTGIGLLHRDATGLYELTNNFYPPIDTTTAIQMFQADKTTSIFAADTVSGYFSFGKRSTSVPLTTLHIIDDSDNLAHKYPRGILCDAIDEGANGVHIGTYKARGIRGSSTTLLDGDFLGCFLMAGYNGTGYIDAVSMGSFRDTMSDGTRWGDTHSGDWDDNPEMATSFYILTQDIDSYSMRFFIDSSGHFGIGRNNILPNAQLDILAQARTSKREDVVKWRVSDCSYSAGYLTNAGAPAGYFCPAYAGYSSSGTYSAIQLKGMVSATADAADYSDFGVIDIFGTRTSSATDPNNGTFASLVNRKLLTVRKGSNASDIVMCIFPSGNVGIGTIATNSMLEINAVTGNNLRLTYNDSNGSASYYVDHLVTAAGIGIIGPSAGIQNFTADVRPTTDNTYYLGKNDDDTPQAWKGLILKDQGGAGKYYRLEVYDSGIRIVDLTD